MKKTNFNLILLNSFFMLGLLMSNLFGGKLVSLFGFIVTGAIIIYPITFLTTDIISEIWGKKQANECVKIGVIIQLSFLLLGYLSLNIPALEQSVELQNSLKLVLNQGVRMTLASLGAFSCSQFLDIYIFHRLKEKHSSKYKWLRNNASTMTSQFIDTIIFITIAFYGVVDNLFLMVIAQYTVKFFLALLDTPFFYLLTREETKVDKQAS
ncbi:queuosine precursor transporter [Clostridioides difficile]|uniref:queuosine precursor transporter n=1 Tax=Clostridioides difficile TaxID=1496 RepID=UPI002549EDE1|nr:queuosine precursor transporter [Clostridioides difficile]MDL0353405.1 queuosine precursor transporter [Clostridioides difficile]HBL5345953.1 queuosine precursor transporter [Clostridioides difficile]